MRDVLGVAFEGCACRAAFHAGVANALVDGGVRIAATAGASSGSLIAAALAAGRSVDLRSIWRGVSGRSIVSLRRFLWNRSPFDLSHLVRQILERWIRPLDMRAQATEALVVATRLRGLRPVVFSSRVERSMVEPLLASCFFPVFYGRPVRLRGELYIDGGFSDNLPIAPLVERGCDEIIAVVASPDGTAFSRPLRPRMRPPVKYVVHPSRPLGLRSWDFNADAIARAMDEGYARGREFLGN